MTSRSPHKTRRSKVAQNIVNNTPAGGWRLAKPKEKVRLGISSKEPFYVRKNVKVRKGSVFISRDEFTVKAFGLHRRKLAEVHATEEGAAHPRHGYKRPLSEKMRALLRTRRRLALVREARRVYERQGAALAATLAGGVS